MKLCLTKLFTVCIQYVPIVSGDLFVFSKGCAVVVSLAVIERVLTGEREIERRRGGNE